MGVPCHFQQYFNIVAEETR